MEKDEKNVREAMEDFGIKYPVVQDNEFQIWRSYKNRYWPAKYLIDKQGKVRSTHFGEGKYDETEEMIQQLLSEQGEEVDDELVDIPRFKHQTKTPETYLGYWRWNNFASPERLYKETTITHYRIAVLILSALVAGLLLVTIYFAAT